MKQILFILISIFFLQAPVSSCFGNTPATYICESMAELNKNDMKSDEEKTEENFIAFINKDVIGSKYTSQNGGIIYYAGFSKVNDAYNMMLNFILPASERTKFNKYKKYSSALITVGWKENTKEKSVVTNGFAQLDVTFAKNGKKYTVVFYRKK